MAITVTSTEAKNNFGEMVKLAKGSREGVIVKQYGEPAVVILDYDRVKEMENDSNELRKRKFIEALHELRNVVQEALPAEMSEADRLRWGGMSEEVIKGLLVEGYTPPDETLNEEKTQAT